MKLIIGSILTALLLVFSAAAQTAKTPDSPKNTDAALKIIAENGTATELKAADLAKLPRREIKAKNHDGKETIFSGVDLREVLKLAGVKFGEEGKKANLVSYLTVEAADKYRAVFAMLELEPDFTDKIVLLADTGDGKPLSKEQGNYRLIVPDEKKQARWVRQVIVLRITKI